MDNIHELPIETLSWRIILTFIQVKSIVKPGCSQDVLKAALSAMASVTDVLALMSSSSMNGQTPL